MKFKVEVTMLVVAIALFIAATFFYSYHATTGALTLSVSESAVYPYRIVALAFVGVGALSMVSASISYSRKTKNLLAHTA